MSDKIEQAAELSVARGTGFAGLGIVTMMVGLITVPYQALQIGGIFALIVSLVLVAKAVLAHMTPYKRTEVWLLLDPADRPVPSVAQRMITTARRGACFKFAYVWAAMSAAMLLTSLALRLAAG